MEIYKSPTLHRKACPASHKPHKPMQALAVHWLHDENMFMLHVRCHSSAAVTVPRITA